MGKPQLEDIRWKTEALDDWKSQGLKCYYARFQTPVPPYKNQEPVSEFRLSSQDKKYVVDELFYTPMGFIWSANGETNITPLANVLHIRL